MLRQHPCKQPDDAIKHWFSDPDNDLFVWETQDGAVTAFQFSYNKSCNEHLLSWSNLDGYSHNRIDDGEDVYLHIKMSPIFLAKSAFNAEKVAESFRHISTSLNPQLMNFIYRKLLDYPKTIQQS